MRNIRMMAIGLYLLLQCGMNAVWAQAEVKEVMPGDTVYMTWEVRAGAEDGV